MVPDARPGDAVAAASGDVLLDVRDLRTHISTRTGIVKAVDGISFQVRRGESVGIVGESGSGKTITCLSILRLFQSRATRIVGGEVHFDGQDLTKVSERRMRGYRGRRIAMVMQDPSSALNPVLTIGDQVGEPLRYHGRHGRRSIRERVVEVLEAVRIPDPAARLKRYPHQFSGGMQQRIVAAMGLAGTPSLMIADEPTTALDVTVQAQFLDLLRDVQQRTGMSVLWVTHDLGIVAQMCDTVNVMYAGRIVESGPVAQVLKRPQHPYTEALLASVPKLGERRRRLYQIEGQPPDLARLPEGCRFYDRCPIRMDQCRDHYPSTVDVGGIDVACWARR